MTLNGKSEEGLILSPLSLHPIYEKILSKLCLFVIGGYEYRGTSRYQLSLSHDVKNIRLYYIFVCIFINPFKFEIMSIHMIRLKECFIRPYFDLTCD